MSRSIYQQRILSGIDVTNLTNAELESTFLKLLKQGIHGISFSA